jgi:succinoglycan biosynthesis protein ExoL
LLRSRDIKRQDGDTIAVFEPDLSETTTLARVGELRAGGFRPLVLGFRRARYNRLHVAAWDEIELGRTKDGRYWHRLTALLRALPVIFAHRLRLAGSAAFLARNLDQLCLALLARALFSPAAPLIYEVVDIQPSFTRFGWRSRAIRLIERLCLRRIDLLVVSSPAFQRDYFLRRQNYGGEWLLVENKLRLSPAQLAASLRRREAVAKPLAPGKRWTIGYFGLIRGQETIELMLRLAQALPDRIAIKFRGVITTVDAPWFHAAIAATKNVSYDGEYRNPADLASLYGSVDLVWALDLENAESNSRWLMPCRFYEAGLFGVPCLAVRGFEIGAALDRLGLGWTFAAPLEEALIGFFTTLSVADYAEKRRNLLAAPLDSFAAGSEIGELCRKIEQLSRRKRRSLPSAAGELGSLETE